MYIYKYLMQYDNFYNNFLNQNLLIQRESLGVTIFKIIYLLVSLLEFYWHFYLHLLTIIIKKWNVCRTQVKITIFFSASFLSRCE